MQCFCNAALEQSIKFSFSELLTAPRPDVAVQLYFFRQPDLSETQCLQVAKHSLPQYFLPHVDAT